MLDMSELNYHDDYSPRRSFLPKEGAKRITKKVFDKGVGNNPGNGFPVQMAEGPDYDDEGGTLQPLQETKGPSGTNNVPQIIYGNYKHGHMSLQVKVYNFLERPTGWKCFAYHFTV